MFRDMSMVMGHDFGLAINVGPAMTWKILKENG
jgi:hypothetical protein